MKKIGIRIIGALCLVAALLVLVFPTWVQIDGISRKEMRTIRTQQIEDLEHIETKLLEKLADEDIKDDLRDCDLPSTSGKIKKRFRTTEALLKELLNNEVSIKEVMTVAAEIPQYIKDTENLLNTSLVADLVFTNSVYFSQQKVEDVMDMAAGAGILAYILIGVLVLLLGLGAVSAVSHCLNKARWLKYIFIVCLLALVIGVCVGAPVISAFIQDAALLPPSIEYFEIRTTAMPYIAVLLSAVPVVLDIVFERKKKAIAEV